MRRLIPVLVAVSLWPGAAQGQTRETVEVVKVDGVIDQPMADYLVGSLDQAERDGATVVIQLDSPGTIGVSAVGLADRIHDATVPVVVWVGPPGSRAAGAGVLFLYASSLAVTSPGSGIGPLRPLDLAHEPEGLELDSGIRGRIETWGEEHARGTFFLNDDGVLSAQRALDESVVEAPGQGVQDSAAVSVPDLLEKIDGLTVSTSEGDVTLATASSETPEEGPGALVRYHDLGPWRRILHAVTSPTAIYVLLVLGGAGLAFELTQRGFGFSGISGALAIALAAYGMAVVPPWWPGLAMLVGGILLMSADVLVRRLGVMTYAGLAAFAAGSFTFYKDASAGIDISPWLIGGAIAASFLYYGFGLTVAVQSKDRLASTQRGLVGLVGEARGRLDPEGAVHVKGALWRARSDNGPIQPGTKVRIRGVDGLVLQVEPEEED
ncbi:MAG: NfeD family protein [Actinomycetota bacterium]